MRQYCGNTGLYYFVVTYGVVRLIRKLKAVGRKQGKSKNCLKKVAI
jgi:hypothetical protein